MIRRGTGIRGACAAIAVAAAALFALPGDAGAVSTEYELLEPMPLPEAGFMAESAKLMPYDWTVGALMQIERDPVVLAGDGGTTFVQDVVSGRWQLRLLGSYRLWDYAQVGLDLPITLRTGVQFFDQARQGHTHLNDMILRARVPIHRWYERWGTVHVGISGALKLPTGDEDVFGGSGDRFAQPTVMALAQYDYDRWFARANLGYAERDHTTIDRFSLEIGDRLLYRLSGGVDGYGKYEPRYFVELVGSTQVNGFLSSAQHDATELMGGAELHFGDWVVTPGVGLGLTKAYGVPAWRMITSVFYAPGGFEDPKVPVYQPRPPVFGELWVRVEVDPEAEAPGGMTMPPPPQRVTVAVAAVGRSVSDATSLGAPSVFALREGPVAIRAFSDRWASASVSATVLPGGLTEATLLLHPTAPAEPPPPPGPARVDARIQDEESGKPITAGTVAVEDFTRETTFAAGFTAGTYVTDVTAGSYRFAFAAEGYFPSRVSLEVAADRRYNLTVELPKKGDQKVVVTQSDIFITEQIFFETGSAKILAESDPILDDLAQVFLDNPQVRKVRISGHTDSRGARDYNLKLSRDRAESVFNALVDRGIDPARLEFVGYGPDRPIDTNETAEGRANNRRVEFLILERGDAAAAAPAAATAPEAATAPVPATAPPGTRHGPLEVRP